MSHQHIREEQIVDYILGQLSSEEHFKINTHLATCKKCINKRDHWEKYLNVNIHPIPSPNLKHKIFSKIHQKKNHRKNAFPFIAASFCVAIIFFIGMFQYSKSAPNINLGDSSTNLTEDENLLEFIPLQSTHHETFNRLSSNAVNHNLLGESTNNREYIYVDSILQKYENAWLLRLEKELHTKIIFVNNDSVCSYEPTEKRISCVQVMLDLQTNRLIPIDSKTFQFIK